MAGVFCGCKNKELKMKEEIRTVQNVDIQKYLGLWYEIARYPHSFEQNLVGVSAEYSLAGDGKIKVVNTGYKGGINGEKSVAIGKAKIPNPSDASKLKVSFFWIFYADYFILDLDTVDYQWSIVGSSSKKYLWILSRQPKISTELYDTIIKKITNLGYDSKKLIIVEQK